ncbi:hypothetical protein ON010_g1638 [Phytophthora cinnamomi]|nr:hypothetical protein ON010_g1638 [Phytophthora cinnamomi]
MIFFLFNGFNPPGGSIPTGYKWLYDITPHKYSLALVASLVFGDCPSDGDGSEIGCQVMTAQRDLEELRLRVGLHRGHAAAGARGPALRQPPEEMISNRDGKLRLLVNYQIARLDVLQHDALGLRTEEVHEHAADATQTREQEEHAVDVEVREELDHLRHDQQRIAALRQMPLPSTTVKDGLAFAAMLARPSPDGVLAVFTDASDTAWNVIVTVESGARRPGAGAVPAPRNARCGSETDWASRDGVRETASSLLIQRQDLCDEERKQRIGSEDGVLTSAFASD